MTQFYRIFYAENINFINYLLTCMANLWYNYYLSGTLPNTVNLLKGMVIKMNDFFNNILNWLADFAMTFGAKLIGAALILFIGFKLVNLLLKLIRKSKKFQHIDPGAETFIYSFLSITLRLIIVLTAVAVLGVPMTNFITILGSAGLAIGLALQGTLTNFAGGLMILIFRPFKVGDFISGADVSGTVKEITILYTVLDTPDNVHIVVPNGNLSNATVQNYSVNSERRVDFEFGVAYKTDLKTAQNVLREIAENNEMVLKDKDIFIRIGSYDESQITLKMRVWVKAADYWNTFFDINEKVKEAFDNNGIEIPFPQLDVHFDKQ